MIDFLTVLSQQPALTGRYVRVERAGLEHVADLQRVVEDGETYNLFFTVVPHPSELEQSLRDTLAQVAEGRQKIYVIRDLKSGAVVGATRYYDIDASVPKLAIGYTYYAESVRRTAINTETKLLMLRFAFEVAGAESVFFHTSFQNLTSRRAIERLGARQDGILRADKRHKDGTLRDTVVYSILRHEWPAVQSQLIGKLAAHDPLYTDPSS